MVDAPSWEGNRVGKIRKTLHLILRGPFPSLPTKKTTEPNLLILVVFFVALRL